MRCILVNGANLKADTFCAHCGNQVGESYVREIGTRLIYCDYHCYGIALKTSVSALEYRLPSLGAWTRSS